MEFYHTARRTFAGLIEEGRRQLQAHVRLRTTSHSLGPSFNRAPRSTRRNRPLTAIVTPNGPMLGTRQPHRPPHTTGLPVDSAFRIEPNRSDGCRLDIGAVHLGVQNRIGLWWDTQPNESRLSCGAKVECSQIEFYNTAWKTFSGFVVDGRRQLQALVRLRATSHGSGPALPGRPRSTHRRCPSTGPLMPNGPI